MKQLCFVLTLCIVFVFCRPEKCDSKVFDIAKEMKLQREEQILLIEKKLWFYVDYWADYYHIDGVRDVKELNIITKDKIYDLAKGIVRHESGFYPLGMSYEKSIGVYSYGLMRLLEATAREMKWKGKEPRELLDIDTNIKYGVKYLCWQIHRYHSLNRAVASYNAGHCKYQDDGETYVNQGYVDIVYYDYYASYRSKREREI